jgi:general secretion pathway protein K
MIMAPADARQGIVLVTVLWAMALLSALAMAAAISFRGFSGVIALDRDRVQADALLTAGLESAVGSIVELADAPIDDMETTTVLSSGSVSAHLSDEGGRIDIGKAPIEMLAGAFRVAGAPTSVANDMAHAIAQWRKAIEAERPGATLVPPNSAPTPPNSGGKKTESEQLFTDLRQLARVPGVEPQWVAAATPLMTVYGSETVNPLTASAGVLAALPGVDMGRATTFVQRRRELAGDAAQLAATLGTAKDYLAIKSPPVLSVHLVARLSNGFKRAAHTVIVLMAKDSPPYRILVWNPLRA